MTAKRHILLIMVVLSLLTNHVFALNQDTIVPIYISFNQLTGAEITDIVDSTLDRISSDSSWYSGATYIKYILGKYGCVQIMPVKDSASWASSDIEYEDDGKIKHVSISDPNEYYEYGYNGTYIFVDGCNNSLSVPFGIFSIGGSNSCVIFKIDTATGKIIYKEKQYYLVKGIGNRNGKYDCSKSGTRWNYIYEDDKLVGYSEDCGNAHGFSDEDATPILYNKLTFNGELSNTFLKRIINIDTNKTNYLLIEIGFDLYLYYKIMNN